MPDECESGTVYQEASAINPAWVQTLRSGAVDLIDPTPEQINFDTIVDVLAITPRFGGHTESWPCVYSVAQHLAEGAFSVARETGRDDWAAAFLLHDAHEALIGDDTSPKVLALATIADRLIIGGGVTIRVANTSLKTRLDTAIYTAAGIGHLQLDAVAERTVKLFDIRMCRSERDARLAPPPYPWADAIENAEPLPWLDLSPWSAQIAREQWVRAFEAYIRPWR
jgi:uncharacterized protein